MRPVRFGARRARRAAVLVTLAALGAAASACGVPNDAMPRPIPLSQVPAGLVNPAHPATTTTTEPGALVPVSVYLVSPGGQYLAQAARAVRAPGSLEATIDGLLAGPTVAESATGVTTAITKGSQLLDTTVRSNVALVTVNFDATFGLVNGSQQVLAVAQVVYTVTNFEGRKVGVSFELEGTPLQVPTGSGAQVSRPVTIADYPNLFPAPPAASTTAPLSGP
ncbi:MAG TPA: GerMN domain-containing protein [Acidimicrobiales bacterium]|nr:GerMN domain-containing protein [Acidimicrobiales bacterium]